MMTKSLCLLFFLLIIFSFDSSSAEVLLLDNGDTLAVSKNGATINSPDEKKSDQKKKRLVSALFAFPFPFGFVGAHRVMLGTKPWIPVVYVATFGGCFGLLPLIDFCVITFSKDIEQYENNPKLFMWISPKENDTGASTD